MKKFEKATPEFKKKLSKAQKARYESRCEHNRWSWLVGDVCTKCKKLDSYKHFMSMTDPQRYSASKLLTDKKDELIKTQEEYIKFLSNYISRYTAYLYIHGVVAKKKAVKKGKDFREKIAELKKDIYE